MSRSDSGFWSEERRDNAFDEANKNVKGVFPNAYDRKKEVNGVVLTYRAGQVNFAKQVMNAIRNNYILIVQAGVGIGKTIGYLVPIFYSYDKVKSFNKIVISTSNIGLQQQLLTDINKVSNMLGIEISAVIAKGINNYACLNRIHYVLNSSRTSEEYKAIIRDLLREIEKKSTVDKDELAQISEEVWELVKFKNRGVCSNCTYSRRCPYHKIASEVNKAHIIVTNHNILARSVLDNRDFIRNADMFVFDEAHKLEDAVRDIQSGVLDFDKIKKTLFYYVDNNIVEDPYYQDYIIQTIFVIRDFFGKIGSRGKGFFYHKMVERSLDILDCDKIPFKIEKIEGYLENVINRLNGVLKLVKNANYNIKFNNDYREDLLSTWIDVFSDMLMGKNSQNIYWIDFLDDKSIQIGYTKKKISDVTDKIVDTGSPVVCVSGTLCDSNNTYAYFKGFFGKLSASKQTIVDGKICDSPYDYKNNSLFYYDKTIANPNDEHQKYLDDLVIRIKNLIKITNGRSLVLFTCKSDMNYVYNKLDKSDLPFKILIQGQDKNNSMLYEEFEKNSKSCLFSTGAWEGIDIKGKSLSNVIITRLPFSVNNAIMQYKASQCSDSVYENDMLQKLAQGTGRLIRSFRDKGAICCLDSRFENYIDVIRNVLSFENYTNNFDELEYFLRKHVTNQDGPRGPYGPRKVKKLVKNEEK